MIKDVKKGVMTLALALLYVAGAAQDSCNCKTNLLQFADLVARNYAGYQDKVNDNTRASYTKLVDSLGKAAGAAQTREECYTILDTYRLFFEDKHLQMGATFHKRQLPAPLRYDDELTDTLFAGGELQWRMLNPSTLYIRIKRCRLEFRPILDSLLKANSAQLRTTPNWIIDFRGNSGGNTDAFSPLLPYFYTKPYYSLGEGQWMSPGNTALFKDFYDKNKTGMDSSSAAYIQKIVAHGTRYPNSWYRDKGDTTVYAQSLEYPKRVAILSDRHNGSSGETFLIVAKGISDKVTVFGENSAGYLDYGNLLRHTTDCKAYRFSIPGRRANYLDHGISYDKTGYPPDVYIPTDEKNWVSFVFRYWNGKPAGRRADHNDTSGLH